MTARPRAASPFHVVIIGKAINLNVLNGKLMRAVLLAGGLGTRFAEETDVRPKPMIEIGGKPILWHIMKIYSSHGINDFIICLGYKGYVIKEYFSNYFLHQSNVTFDLRENRMEVLHKHAEPWRVTLIDTGEETMIGGRIKRILPYIGDDDAFCLTYGDGVADIDITESIAFHRREGRLATVTGTQPPGRFGAINHQGRRVHRRRRHRVGERADDETGGGRPAQRIPPRRVLAPDGYVAGQALPGRFVDRQQGTLEDLVGRRIARAA
jgi:glucose-1-phosphate cytidylyltransferase